MSRPADNSAAFKTAGLAKLAPVEAFVSCGFSEQLDPLLDPLALACLSQPFPAAKAASKPAGLASGPSRDPGAGLARLPVGRCLQSDRYTASFPSAISGPRTMAPHSRPAGLAKLAPAVIPEQGWPGCPWGYGFNPMIHGDVLECLSQAYGQLLRRSKTAGLARLAPVEEQFGPCGSSGESPDPLVWPLACLR